MKKYLFFCGLILFFSVNVFSNHILYKDFTGFHSQLVCCNSSDCFTYSDYMTHNISGWENSNNPITCYEVKSIFKEVDLYSSIINNILEIFGIILIFVVIIFILRQIIKEGKK